MFGIDKAEASDRFSDVSNNHWAAKEISFVNKKGIATGDETGKFRPDEPVLRSQASVMMTRALGKDGLDRKSPTFSDVDQGYWAYDRIERAAEMGIFKGKDGNFKPNNDIKKAQVAAVVARAFFGQKSEHFNGNVNFNDVSNDFWAKGYIATLVDNNIIKDGGSFNPNDRATRAELSAYIARAMDESLNASGDDNNGSVAAPDDEVGSDKNVLYEGVVQASTPLNLRTGPGTSHSIIDSLQSGTKVEVYATEGNWLSIGVGGKEGYVHSNYIVKGSDAQESVDNSKPLYTRQAKSSVLVRSGPGASHDRVGTLNRGETVKVYEETSGSWVLIKFNGDWAYTHSDYLGQVSTGSGSLSGKTIVIDAGHGGHDPGTSGNGLVEKNIVLDVALLVRDRLKNEGMNVVMTRTDDTFVTLSGRVRIAENANADSFVSIHANAFSPSANGAETFYHSRHQAAKSKALASKIQEHLVRDTGMHYRRVDEGNYHVIRETSMPSTLVELGFVTNSGDAARMKKPGYNEKAATAIVKGIKEYYG